MGKLLQRAKEIRDEVRIGKNTASRVGGLLMDMVALLEGEGTDDWFVERLKSHIDNETVYWDEENKVIKARGGVQETLTILVGVNTVNIGQCSVKATGDVVNTTVSADKGVYTFTVKKGGNVTVVVVPEEGYRVRQLNVDQVDNGAISEYLFEDIDKEHTMYVWMEEAEENPTEFLIRSDMPGMYYSSTQDALNAIKTAYPNGLTQNVTITCIKEAREKRLTGTWIAELTKWNTNAVYYLTIDGADKLVYDGKSLGGLQLKEVDNVLLRNISFVNCANYAGNYSPSEVYALNYIGNANRYARNLMVYQCIFNGAYPTDATKKAYRTIGSKYSENLTVLGCNLNNDYGNCIKLSNCLYVSLLKNTVSVDYSLNVVAHPSILTLKNCYTLTVEDNKMSGDVRENYFELSNIDRLYFRRNDVSGGGGRVITMSNLGSMKEVAIDSNLFVGMLNSPAGGWMKEYFNLCQIDNLKIRNNTIFMNGSWFEQYVTRGGTVTNADIFNNIVINATIGSGNSINGFVINKVKNLNTGNNLYESMRTIIVSPNEDASTEYITLDYATGRDLAKLQKAGYEANSIKVEDGTKLLEKQDGGDSYKLLTGLEYYSNMAYFPDADIDYKSKASVGNTRGCYNLAGTVIDETQEITGYTGEDYSEGRGFNSAVQYSTMADSILHLKHNTLDRMKLVVFSVIGSQHSALVIGRSGIIHTYPVLDADNEYQEDELYTINVDY